MTKEEAPNSSDTISRQAAIDVNGLDEEIRCEMCKNPTHTDRGCDGNCKYDEKLYKKIIQLLNKRITPLPSAQPYFEADIQKIQDLEQAELQKAYELGRASAQPEQDCILKQFGNCSYSETGCSDCAIKVKIRKALQPAQSEIVRCKDCKYWRRQTNYAGTPLSFGFCESDEMWRSLYGETYEVSHIDTDDIFYCGYAERREE